MFDFVRKHTKIMMGLMFLLIIPSFVLFGIDGYNRMREKGDAVARVGGQDITQGEWDAAHKAEADRLRARAATHVLANQSKSKKLMCLNSAQVKP